MTEEIEAFIRDGYTKDYPALRKFVPDNDLASEKQILFELLTLKASIFEYVCYLNIDDERENKKTWSLYEKELTAFIRKQQLTKEKPEDFLVTIQKNMKEYQVISKFTIKEIQQEVFIQFGKKLIKLNFLKKDYVFKKISPTILNIVKNDFERAKKIVTKDQKKDQKK